jgi:HPt (histidine-containing phosphotransfer) domain-containing protein
MSEDSTINDAAIARLQEWGGDKLVREMVRLYLENVVARLEQIDQGLGEGPLEHTKLGAHSLKSSALNVGAGRVGNLAAELEALAGAGDREGATELRPSLGEALDDARAALLRIVAELPS